MNEAQNLRHQALNGKVALITGGAKRVGAAMVRELHAHGTKVLIHCNRSTSAAEALADELNQRRPDSAAVTCLEKSSVPGKRSVTRLCEMLLGADVTLIERALFSFPTTLTENFFVYVFGGRIALRDDRSESWLGEGEVGLLTKGDTFTCSGGKDGARFLLIGGKPLGESVAWHGPIVMNTDGEIQTALEELNTGEFVKTKG